MALATQCIMTISYNSMQIIAYSASILFLILSLSAKGKRMPCFLFSGIFAALAIQAYPTTLPTLFVFLGFLLFEPSLSKNRTERIRALGWFVVGGLLVLGAFLLFVQWNSSLEALAASIPYILLDPEHVDKRFTIIGHFRDLYFLLGEKTFFALSILCAAALAATRLQNVSLRKIAKIGVLAGSCVVVGEQLLRNMNRFGTYHIYQQMPFAFSSIAPILFLLNKRRWHPSLWLVLLGVVCSMGVNLGTNNGAHFYVYPYAFSACGTILYAANMTCFGNVSQPAKALLALPCIAALGLMLCASITYVYRDGQLNTLNEKIAVGPYAGLYTSAAQAEKHEELIQAINDHMPKEGHVLYTRLLPFGYLCSEALPGTPRLWRTNLDYALFDEYYQKYPESMPDAVFIASSDYGLQGEDIRFGSFFKRYFSEKKCTMIETKPGRIILIQK